MAKSRDNEPQATVDIGRIHKALTSIGVDQDAAKKLAATKTLDRVVVPVYWKEGLESRINSLGSIKLPEFLKSFAKEFPDGQVRWDSDYESDDPADDVAVLVRFNVQEDDQGNHWHPKPTLLEDEAYQRMIERSSFKGTKPVHAHQVVHGK